MAIVWDSDQPNHQPDSSSSIKWDDETPPLGGSVAKFLFPTAGAIAGGMAAAPLTAAGVEAGSALGALGGPLAPITIPAGAILGGMATGGLASYLGATGADVGRKYLSAKAGGQPAPDFLKTVGQTAVEQAPMIPFGAASEVAGAGLRAAAPMLEEAPRFLQAFTRGGTIANTATRSAAGGLAGGTAQGLMQGQSLPQAVQEGVRQAPKAAILGGAIQAVPNAVEYMRGNPTDVKASQEALTSKQEELTQAQRTGTVAKFLGEKQKLLWKNVEKPIVADSTPIPLREYINHLETLHGVNSPQVQTLLRAFGEKAESVSEEGTPGARALRLEPSQFEEMQQKFPGQFEESQSSRGAGSLSLDRPIAPQEALTVASKVSERIHGGASSGFSRGFSQQDSVNNDVRAGIYDVVKSRLDAPSQQAVSDALHEYGKFATLRDRVLATVQPHGNVNTPTSTGNRFFNRLASGKSGPGTPDDIRLAQFLQEAHGQPVTETGQELSGNLPKLFQASERAKQYGATGRYAGRTATRIGLLYPLFRAIRGTAK